MSEFGPMNVQLILVVMSSALLGYTIRLWQEHRIQDERVKLAKENLALVIIVDAMSKRLDDGDIEDAGHEIQERFTEYFDPGDTVSDILRYGDTVTDQEEQR